MSDTKDGIILKLKLLNPNVCFSHFGFFIGANPVQSQVEILPNGDDILNIDDNLGIKEHPEMDESESEWRKWAIEGMSKNFGD